VSLFNHCRYSVDPCSRAHMPVSWKHDPTVRYYRSSWILGITDISLRTTAYLRLVVLSSGFQYAVKQGISRDSPIVQQVSSKTRHNPEHKLNMLKSISVARSVIHQMTERLYPTGNLRYAMEVCSAILITVSYTQKIFRLLFYTSLLPQHFSSM
jgi:hypothetical protein